MYINLLFIIAAANAGHSKDSCVPSGQQSETDSVYIEGCVWEKGTQNPLEGIIVRWKGTSHSVLTNAEGRYRIGRHSGNNILVFSRPGWKEKTIRISRNRNRKIHLRKLKLKHPVNQPEEDLPPDSLLLPGLIK